EDGASREEGIATEHPADRDLGEAGGEVVQPGAELEEQGSHAGWRAARECYRVAGRVSAPGGHREAAAFGQEQSPAAWAVVNRPPMRHRGENPSALDSATRDE